MSIKAVVAWRGEPAEKQQPTDIAPCQRCGILRKVNQNRPPAPVCKDCKFSIPMEMWPAWGIPLPRKPSKEQEEKAA